MNSRYSDYIFLSLSFLKRYKIAKNLLRNKKTFIINLRHFRKSTLQMIQLLLEKNPNTIFQIFSNPSCYVTRGDTPFVGIDRDKYGSRILNIKENSVMPIYEKLIPLL